jgi:hypothetical protein
MLCHLLTFFTPEIATVIAVASQNFLTQISLPPVSQVSQAALFASPFV